MATLTLWLLTNAIPLCAFAPVPWKPTTASSRSSLLPHLIAPPHRTFGAPLPQYPRGACCWALPPATNGDQTDDDDTSAPLPNDNDDDDEESRAHILDDLLQDGKLGEAVSFLQQQEQQQEQQQQPLPMTSSRWEHIFSCIESHTAAAEENQLRTTTTTTTTSSSSSSGQAQYPPHSPARMDMTRMYQTLQSQGYLSLFGAIDAKVPPAAGSHTLTPHLLEQITNLTMKALTPKPTNNLLWAGAVLAIAEGLVSLQYGIDLNVLVLMTVLLVFLDKLVVNGAVFETLIRIVSPGLSQKIAKHEAGHFLCAYLLGCPVEGYVLSSWAALQDERFHKRQVVSAGTSFFDATLSQEYAQSQLTRSSVDRYSIIVMAGIAAEALEYGRADGGAGDEMALIYFLSQLNHNHNNHHHSKQWNDTTIRNQARWGALQAVLMMQYYKPCYTALVDVMERGGTLGDCIFAIEKAGRDHGLGPLKEPMGMILEEGPYGKWTTDLPKESLSQQGTLASDAAPKKQLNEQESLETLQEYKHEMEKRLREIDERLEKL